MLNQTHIDIDAQVPYIYINKTTHQISMPEKPEKPFPFWQELKRRKVIGVIPVYAAAAFVLLELADIIAGPLGLPDWTIRALLILLLIGLIITIIVAWIYDITPEGVQKASLQVKSIRLKNLSNQSMEDCYLY